MAEIDGKKVLVGAGGWLEYKKDKVPINMRLKVYANEFDFVEVNTTFYQILHPQTIRGWRKRVPSTFEFSVKCYKALTHEIGLKPVEDAYRVLDLMRRYCEILSSNILIMQMPPSLKLDDKFVRDATDFFNSINLGDLRIAFEFRVTPSKMPTNLVGMLRDFNMAHTVDLSFEDPRFESDLLYSRVFGSAEKNNMLDHTDTNQIKKKVAKSKSDTVRVVGHSLKMIEDTRKIKEALRS